MPHACTLTRTSRGPGCGISRSTISNGPPGRLTWTTRILGILVLRERPIFCAFSPDLHTTIDDDVSACYVRALVGRQEERDTRHFLRLTGPTQQRLAEHRDRIFRIL